MDNLAGPAATPTSTASKPQTADTTTPSPASPPASPPAAPEEKDSKIPPPNPQLETLCKTMCGKGLRTYITSQLPLAEQENTLRQQLTEALKLAPNAAKLVLSCMGDFYARRGKDLNKDTRMISYKEASALVLECFLLMGLDEIDEAVSKEAEQAAVIWRRRLVDERIKKASEMDARGLLLLIGCFGIPQVFKNEDIRGLIRKSNIRGIKSALRRSNVLIERIPEIIEDMVKLRMEVDAVDVVYTFGVEEKISPYRILTSFLREFKESLKKRKWKSHGLHDVVNEANKRELSTMKSVIECLEAHNIDPSKLLRRFRIIERIESLEKKIARNDQRRVQNWKYDETGLSRRAKRTHIPGSEQQRADNHICSQRPLLEGGTAGRFYGYSLPPPVLPGPVTGSIAETVPGSLAASGGGVVMGGFGSGITSSTDNVLQAGSYAGFYGWQGDASMHERSVSYNYGYGSLPPWQGSIGLPNTVPVGVDCQSSVPNTVPVGVDCQSSAADPYQLPNTVPESAQYQDSSSYAIGAVPSVNPRSS